MRAPAVSFAKRFFAAFMAALLTFALVPSSALAEGEGDSADAPDEEPQEVSTEQVDEGSGVAPMLASGLVGNPSSFVSADVALDSEPIIGSFTVDGLTFAVVDGTAVELVGVLPDWKRVTDSQEGEGSPVAPMLASGPDGLAGDSSTFALPESIAYEGVDYAVASIGAYAFYLSGVASVELPVSIAQVDDRAFRSSDVASVTVADGNATYSSFDGALYDAAQSSLLLIPEGKQGTVLLPKTAEVAPPSVFSHCSLVQAIAVEEGSAAFASENGLLYDASLATLLRVPAGATDITIRDGCTTIAAGAMEACASLATITAPATVTSISPYLFEQEPETVMAPVAVAAVEDEAEGESAEESGSTDAAPQLTALVALSSTDDDLPTVDPAAITVSLPIGAIAVPWQAFGFVASVDAPAEGMAPFLSADIQSASTYSATTGTGLTLASVTYNPGSSVSSTRKVYKRQYDKDGAKFTDALQSTSTFTGQRTANAWLLWSGGSSILVFLTDDPPASGSNQGNSQIYESWAPSRAGYSVTGWKYMGSSFSAGCEVHKLGAGTLEPVWKANTYTVSFNANGGSGGQSSNVTATYAANMPGISTTKPTRTGYTFGGWYDTSAATGGTQYYTAAGASARTWNKTANTTLYARWTANAYTVEYWNKAGTTKLSSDTGFVYDTARNLAAKPTSGVNAGYTAVGWSGSTNQSTATYGFSSSQKNLATSGTKKLYLAETANTITLTWNSDGGSAVANTSATYSSTAKVPMPGSSPTKAGYTFKGWFTSTTSTTQVTSSTALPTSNTTYYAQWTANTITLTWDSNGGSSVADTSATYSSTAKVPMPSSNPTRAGYTFAGWWTAASGGTQVTSSTALPTANATYYAHWSLNPYAITYELNGGSVSGNPTTYNTETTSFTLKNPTRTGYTFAGWSGTGLAGEANMAVTVAKGSTGDRAYTAHWLPTISADLPLEVTARVDVLGLEEQEEATGYIESRCGEPLTVADVAFEPLSGAVELFGAAAVADVALEVLASGSTSPDARFALDASASQAPASSAAFRMASYGTRVPISYRFAIPDELLPSLVEIEKPVCSVAYTVALA